MEESLNWFLNREFWRSAATHVALAPEETAEGLREFVDAELGLRGWCLFQTSGSGGKRKWVGLTKESLLISARAVNAHFCITDHDHWLLALPIWHVGGFGILARGFVSGSSVSVMDGKWDAQKFAQRCDEAGATLASLVPTQVFDLVAVKLSAPKSMRIVLVGGGAMSREVEESALKLGWPVRRTYGMTETATQVASQSNDADEMEVLPIWNVRTDENGVLSVRGEALAKGYAFEEAGVWRWEPISAEAGLSTRDRVSLWNQDTRQFLHFVDREANTVKILGELVSLGAIQKQIEILRLELSIREGEAVVCDVPDARCESRLLLILTQMSAEQGRLLQKGLNEMLRPFERISEVREVSAIPRSSLGKVCLAELRRLL